MKRICKEVWPGRSSAGIAAVVLLAGGLAAEARGQGVVMRSETRDLARGGGVEAGEALIQGRMFRAEMSGMGEPGEEGAIVFDGARQVMTAVNHRDRTFFELTAERIRSMMAGVGDQLQAAMKQMEQQLANLPPDQRRQVEALMKQQLGGVTGGGGQERRAPEIEVRSTGAADSVDGTRCREVEVLSDGEKTQEICVASWSSVGLDSSSFAVFEDFGAFFEEVTAAIPQGPMTSALDNPFVSFRKLDGFPIRIRSFEGGAASREVTLTVSERRPIAPSEFEPPAGYRRQDPFGGAPR